MSLQRLAGMELYPRSLAQDDSATFALAHTSRGPELAVMGDPAGFEGEVCGEALLCPLTSANVATLRARLPWLRPQPLGLAKSFGFGDRLGLATPGHIRALRQFAGVAPVFAQQSVRENARTGRSPQQVVDEAMWGVFQEGWRQRWGADADHLKTLQDVDDYVAAGYTLYTIDPGAHVDNAAETGDAALVAARWDALPWEDMQDCPADMVRRYVGRRFSMDGMGLELDQATVLRAAAKYGRAIAHTARMYRHLADRSHRFELEVSVDETEIPTSLQEHLFFATELKRLGVSWVSLAPRYVGRFEKAADYIGDLAHFERELAGHVAIARALGPYKLSIHSGSDKFSIYPIVARTAGDLVHVKTAGTSYLEALRATAVSDPKLFRAILDLARQRYEHDRATYHVSAETSRVPPAKALTDGQLPSLLGDFDAREVLHVTFGSVLDRFGRQLKESLSAHEETYCDALQAHLGRHLAPFALAG